MRLTNIPQTAPTPPRLISALRQYPATEDFSYLCGPRGGNPYALAPVSFDALRRDPEASRDYYTLSVRGLTRFVNGTSAEFTSE